MAKCSTALGDFAGDKRYSAVQFFTNDATQGDFAVAINSTTTRQIGSPAATPLA